VKSFFFILLSSLTFFAKGQQRLFYDNPDPGDKPNTRFQIIGKVGGQILIYKEYRRESFISVYDTQMQEIDQHALRFLPKIIFGVTFINYFDFCYLIYQYQDMHRLYCSAIKIDSMGNKTSDAILLNSVKIRYYTSTGVFQNIVSDNKKYLMCILGIVGHDHLTYQFLSKLFDSHLQLKSANHFMVQLDEMNENFNPFLLEDNGNLVFAKTPKNDSSKYSSTISLLIKKPQVDTITTIPLTRFAGALDQVKIKIDNLNKRYIISSLYYRENSNKISGIFTISWDEASESWLKNSISYFAGASSVLEDGKRHLGGLDDYFIKDIITEKSGAYILIIESEILSYYGEEQAVDRYAIVLNSPIFFDYLKSRYDSRLTGYSTGNILLFSFDANNHPLWNSEIQKKQFDLRGNAQLSYKLLKTPGNIHILYNSLTTGNFLLTDDIVSAVGKIADNPTLKNIDLEYQIEVRLGKQISDNLIVFPCIKKQILSFALLDMDY
jgi:hypothetical protein